MRRMMDKVGLNMKEIPNVQEVIIKTDRKELIISKPSVNEMKAQGSTTFVVTTEDDYEERELEVPVFSNDDIELVCLQANVDKERAIEALTEAKGDLAQAILNLTTG